MKNDDNMTPLDVDVCEKACVRVVQPNKRVTSDVTLTLKPQCVNTHEKYS